MSEVTLYLQQGRHARNPTQAMVEQNIEVSQASI